jgi:hypothetical protein
VRSVERPLGGERPHVKLVENRVVECDDWPVPGVQRRRSSLPVRQSVVRRESVRTACASRYASTARRYDRRMAVTDDRPVADQLAELGAQLAWVRDYL